MTVNAPTPDQRVFGISSMLIPLSEKKNGKRNEKRDNMPDQREMAVSSISIPILANAKKKEQEVIEEKQ